MRKCKMPRLNRANVRWLAAAGAIGVLATTGFADPGLIWDASGVNPTSPTDGAGTWDTSLLNWSNGTSDVVWPNDTTIAIIGDDNGAAGVVNLTSPLQAGGLIFNPVGRGNYSLTGSTLTLANGTVQLNSANPIITANLSTPGDLTISGSGSLTLAGSNSITGTTNITGATLIAESSQAVTGNLNVMPTGGAAFISSASLGNVLNYGLFTIAPGQFVSTGSSTTFQQAGGALNIYGTLAIGSTFNYSGGTVNGTVLLNGSSPTLYLGNNVSTGTFVLASTGSSTTLGTSNISAGLTVLVQPTYLSNEFLSASNSTLINNGTLKLTSPANTNNNSYYVGLIPSLTNNGSFIVQAGGIQSGPAMYTSANYFTNTALGTAIFNASATLSTNVLNSGLFTIAPGQIVSTGSSTTFQQAGGALNIYGTLAIGSTFNYSGGTVNGTVLLNGSSPTLYLGNNVSTGTFVLASTGSSTTLGTSNISAGLTVLVQPTYLSNEFLSASNSTLINNGTLKLTSPANTNNNSYYVGLIPSLTNNGSFIVQAGGIQSGPAMYTSANYFTNTALGTAIFNASATLSTNVLNSGLFTIAPGQIVSTGSSTTFQQAGGALNIYGTLAIGSTFNYSGGTVNGTVLLNGSSPTLYLGNNVSTGTFVLASTGSSTTLGTSNISAGLTVLVEPTYSSSTLLYAPSSALINNGTLKLISPSSSNNSYIYLQSPLTNNGPLTVQAGGIQSGPAMETGYNFINTALGTANFNASATLNTNVLNNGLFTIASGQLVSNGLSGSGTFQQAGGTLNIYGTLAIGSTFNYSGGTINGTVLLNGSSPTLYLGSNVSTGTFVLASTGQSTTLGTSNIPSGVTVLFQPTYNGNPTLSALNSTLINNGALKLTAPNNSSISVQSSLTNNGSFIVQSSGASSASMSMTYDLVNTALGTANFNASASLGNVLSSGVFTIAVGQTVSAQSFQVSGGTMDINGTLKIPSLTWPNPLTAMNPATDIASINSSFSIAGQTFGSIDLRGAEGAFYIADPNATLTITTTINNGSLDKTGPGTLVLNGTENIGGTLNIAGGTLTIGPNAWIANNIPITVASSATLNVMGSIPLNAITNNGTVNFPAQSTPGIHWVQISGLTLAAGQISTIGNPTLHSNRTLLQLGTLQFAGGTDNWQGVIDLTGNDLDLTGGSLADVTNQIKQGYNGGTWQGSGGIISSAAADDTTHLTALGVIQNNQNGTAIYGSGVNQVLFDGIAPGASDILVKYTYYGDANLDGQVDGSDYSRIDAAYLADQATPGEYTGWFNGDFNYDGVIDGSDYTLIDNAFNTQGASLAATIAGAEPTAQISVAAVPEPSSMSLLAVGAVALLRRRTRRAEPMCASYRAITFSPEGGGDGDRAASRTCISFDAT